MYYMIPMQIYLFILLCLTIPLNHVLIMNDARGQQEVGPSMKHLKPRKPLEGYTDINNAALKALLNAHIALLLSFQR